MGVKLTKDDFKDVLKELMDPIAQEHRDFIAEEIKKRVEDLKAEMKKPKEPRIEVTDQAEEDPKGGFKSLSHFALDIAKAAKSGYRHISPELEKWEKMTKAAGSPSANESSDEAGGYLIPDEFRQDLLLAVEQKNEILKRCTAIPMKTSTIKIPYVNGFDESGGLVYGGVEWKWIDEEEQRTATKPKYGRITLTLKKVAGLAYTSDEILEDSPISMENILKNGFRDGLNFQLDKVFLRGSGAGQPLGILNAPCLVTVAKESGQSANTIVFANVAKMYSRISDPNNAVWFANIDCFPQLASMSVAVGSGGSVVWLPANAAAGRPYDTLFGRPLIWCKHCSTLGTVGDIILCDWSQYLVGQKSGPGAYGKFDTSIHLKFDYDQTAFKFTFRVDGQPWWPSALTPPHGSNTLSPFVALATRS